MRRALLGALLLAACGEEEGRSPPPPYLLVLAEDGRAMRGEAFLRTSKVNPQLLTVDLSARAAGEAEASWSFRARVPRDQVLKDEIPELTWPTGTQVVYTSSRTAAEKGTATVSVTAGRMSGEIRSEDGGRAAFVAGAFTIECLVGYFDVPAEHRPPDAKSDEMIPDTLFETDWCNPLKALQ